MLILPSPDHTLHNRLVPVPPRHRVVVPQKSDVAITIRCPVEMCTTLCAVHHSRDSDPSVCLHLFLSQTFRFSSSDVAIVVGSQICSQQRILITFHNNHHQIIPHAHHITSITKRECHNTQNHHAEKIHVCVFVCNSDLD